MIAAAHPDTLVAVVAINATTLRANTIELLAVHALRRVAFAVVQEADGDRGHGVRRWPNARALLVGVLPALLLSLGVGRFILNHFFARAPYLLDSGLLSGIAYRSGALMTPPAIACDYATSFYQVYFSPIISAFSAVSYLVPVQRIEWFAFVQASMYLPIGFAVFACASRLRSRLPVTMIAALAFAFSGITISMIAYPHYEAATPGLVCLVLVGVISDRPRLTWTALALAASVRQDGGLHVALALAPVAYLKWRGTEMAPTLRRILLTIGVAIGVAVLEVALQKLLLTSVDRLGPVYFGSPPYAHLSWALIVERLRDVGTDCQLIYYPFLLTVVLAVVRRDARYLLGWLTTIPWVLLNFTAYDAAKSTFSAYAAGPFLVAMFWVYAYGAYLAPAPRRLRAGVLEAVFALICLSSTLGFLRKSPDAVSRTVRDMVFVQRMNRAQVHGFVAALHAHKAAFGHLAVDDAVAALAQEHLVLEESWPSRIRTTPDSLAFHMHNPGSGLALLPDLIGYGLNVCTHVLETEIHVCTRERLPAETFDGVAIETVPAVLVHSRFRAPGIVVEDRGIAVWNGFSLAGTLGKLPAGTYEWMTTLEAPARVQLRIDDVDGPELVQRFTADGKRAIGYRVTALSPGAVITGVTLRRISPR